MIDKAGEAAFYGPKLDLQVQGSRGNEETIATIQLDFVQPERFGLTYVDADGGQRRPVMIHRGTVGSMERVTAALLERYCGRLPLWLAPTQLTILPVHPKQDQQVKDLVDLARSRGLRVRADYEGSLSSRIRTARIRRDHLIGVIGAAEARRGEITVSNEQKQQYLLTTETLIFDLCQAYQSRRASVSYWVH